VATDDDILTISGLRGEFRARSGGNIEGENIQSENIEVLHSIDLAVRRGAITAIVGETGSGKTLTALTIVGLTPRTFHRTAGSIIFDGTDISDYAEAQLRRLRGARIAMVFQNSRSALNPVFSVGSQLVDVCRLQHGLGRRAAAVMAEELLAQVRITEPRTRLRQYPHELSGGTAQRVQLALALACRPSLLILDEPTTGLDVTIQADILELIVELTRNAGMSTCMITHDLGVVAEMCDDVVVMNGGRVVESGSCEQILTRPGDPYTVELLASSRDEVGAA
jgi:ABC-type glutathione transport system ATPase component